MTEIRKAAEVAAAGTPDEKQLEKINALSKTALRPEDVYVFAVRLCDDQVDRDCERFSQQALQQMAGLFVGRTGILDHEWSADRQVARIFDAQVEYGGGCSFLKGWAYMLRTPENESLIRSIDGGIRREVSVGCAVRQTICSVCGEAYGSCQHRKGETYGGTLCTAVHTDIADAYEFSFVAVPAQKEAGVLKKELVGGTEAELKALRADAELGKRFRTELEENVVKLALQLELGAKDELLRRMAKGLSAEDLTELAGVLEEKCAQLYWNGPQLTTGKEAAPENYGAFLI